MSGDELLDLANILVQRRREPSGFCRLRRDARQLANRRIGKATDGKRMLERRQIGKQFGDTQPLDRSAWRVAKNFFHVRDHRRMTELTPYRKPLGLPEISSF